LYAGGDRPMLLPYATLFRSGAVQTSRRLEPFLRSSQDILDVSGHPHIETLTVTGPFEPTGPGDTPSRRRILQCDGAAAERDCARSEEHTSELQSREKLVCRL